MARLGEAICDRVAAIVDAMTSPNIVAVHRAPFCPSDVNSMPCAFVWLDSADGAKLHRADDKKRWEFIIGVAVVAPSKSGGDVTATLDGFRAGVENALDSDRTLNGTCEYADTEGWSFVYEPGGDDGGMMCVAATTILALKQATRGAN